MNIELRALRSWVIKRVGSWQLNQSRRCFFILCSRPLFSELFSISLLFRIIWTPEITGPIGIIKCQLSSLLPIRVDTRFVWRMKKRLIRWPILLFKRSWKFLSRCRWWSFRLEVDNTFDSDSQSRRLFSWVRLWCWQGFIICIRWGGL